MPPHEMIVGRSWQVEFGVVICEFGQKCGESSKGMMTISIYECEVLERSMQGGNLVLLKCWGKEGVMNFRKCSQPFLGWHKD